LTLAYIQNLLKARKPASLKSCSLLLKPDSLKTPVDVDYTAFKIGGEFVVGYGLDMAGKFRGLPYIGYLEHDH
jgi:hypoxanthine phosphoribosyltransferase